MLLRIDRKRKLRSLGCKCSKTISIIESLQRISDCKMSGAETKSLNGTFFHLRGCPGRFVFSALCRNLNN
jgi:hypothetical protein